MINNKHHRKNLYFVLVASILLSLGGCKSSKVKNRDKQDRELVESSKTTTTRVGDTVTYIVPNVVLKDTVITKTNTVTGTTQVLRYDSEGRLTAAECISGFIEIIEEQNKRLIEAIDQSNKEKETKVPGVVIIYAFIGLALFVLIVLGVAWKVFGKKLKAVETILGKLAG